MTQTILIDDVIEIMRPFYLTENILLLTVSEITTLYSYFDGSNQSMRRGFGLISAHNKLDELAENNLKGIESIRTVLFSNLEMALLEILKIYSSEVEPPAGHFVYADLNLTDGSARLLDSSFSSFADNPYFSEKCVKSFFSFLVKAATYDPTSKTSNMRGLKLSPRLTKTAFTQKSNECGSISLCNLLLSFHHDFDFLSKYTLVNYRVSVYNLKSLIKYILFNGSIPFNKFIVT